MRSVLVGMLLLMLTGLPASAQWTPRTTTPVCTPGCEGPQGPQGPQGPSGFVAASSVNGGFTGPGPITAFGVREFIGPVATMTLQAGQKGFVAVSNNIGVVSTTGYLNLFPCYRPVSASPGTDATMLGQSISVTGLTGSRQTFSVNATFTTGVNSFTVPAGVAIDVGMCVLGQAGNAAWDSVINGYISTLVFQ